MQLTLGQEIRQEIRGTETPMGEGSPNGADAFVRPDPTAILRHKRGGAPGKVPTHRCRPGQAVEESQRPPRELPVECLSQLLNTSIHSADSNPTPH